MKWEVFRQELLVYHARHKRIKFIFEDGGSGQDSSTDGFVRYRRHAQGILTALRDIFKELPKGTEIVLCDDKSKSEITSLNIQLPKKINKTILLKFLKYWQQCLLQEGWNKDSPSYKVIDQFIVQIQKENNSGEICVKKLNKNTLTSLLSTLPALPHWDIWGLSSKKSEKYLSNSTITAQIAGSIESLAYGAQLKFNTPNVESSGDARDSCSLLGYPARLRLCFANTDTNYQEPIFTTEEDFYTFCHYPNNKGNEKQLYQAYGLMFDALTEALYLGSSDNILDAAMRQQDKAPAADSQPASVSDEKLNPEESKESIYFYVAYPITTLQGRRHFWHIWLRPEGDTQQNASLEDLWASWWPIHQRFLNWPVLHAALASELEQLDIAYAQEGIQAMIEKSSEVKNPESIGEIIPEFAYSLFPVSCVCDGNGNVWGYDDYSINTVEEVADFPEQDKDLQVKKRKLELRLGYKWGKVKGDVGRGKQGAKNNKCKDCIGYKKSSASDERSVEIIFNDLGIQTDNNRLRYQHGKILLEKQQYLAERLLKAISHEREIVEGVIRATREQLRQYFTEKSLSIAWRDEILGRLNVGEHWSDINFEDQGTDLKNPKSDKAFSNYQEIAQFLFRGDNYKEEFKRLLAGGQHMFLSMLLETGPAKYLSHSLSGGGRKKLCAIWTKDFCSAFLSNALSNLESFLKTIDPQLSLFRHVEAVYQNYKQLLSSNNTACPEKNSTLLNENAVALKEMRKKHRVCKDYIDCYFKEGGTSKASISFLGSDSDDETIKYGHDSFRVSLPIDHIFQKDHLKELKELVGSNQIAFYRLFALANNQKLVSGETYIFTNYLAIAYQVSQERDAPPDLFQRIDEHLQSIGGNLFVVKFNQSWTWYRIEAEEERTYLPVNSPWPERYDGKKHPNENEYNILFRNKKYKWNCVILFTFHGCFTADF